VGVNVTSVDSATATATSATACALEAHGLRHRFASAPVVDGVDLTVGYGEFLALIGPNGAGKSTLCALLARDLDASEGSVAVAGRPVESYGAKELARTRAVLSQDSAAVLPFPVRDTVMMGRYPHLRPGRAPGPDDHTIVADAMRATGVVHLADRPTTQLSGGEQTRVALARVLAQQARILLLDEPTTALDLRHQQQILRVCRRLADDGCAVLAVLHDLGLAAAWSDRIGVMQRGRLVECGPPSDVLRADLVSEVFEEPVVVVEHPLHGWPVVLPQDTVHRTAHPPGQESP
jgi:iron complex transport system ATP-binding protein